MKFLLFLTAVTCRKILPDENGEYKIVKNLAKNEMSFGWLGDWGGWPAPVYTTPARVLKMI